MIHPSDKEVLRYMGYKGMRDDSPSAMKLIEKCRGMLEPVLRPRSCVRVFPLHFEGQTIRIETIETDSRSLFRNLKGCSQAAVMACTIGIEADRLIQKRQLFSMSESACLDAIASASIEAWCDMVNRQIIEDAKKQGLYGRPRFSPGYGDLPMTMQKELFALLPITKETGITLTESFLMVPAKSVTAIIGLSDHDQNCILQGCEECARSATCMFSRRGESI